MTSRRRILNRWRRLSSLRSAHVLHFPNAQLLSLPKGEGRVRVPYKGAGHLAPELQYIPGARCPRSLFDTDSDTDTDLDFNWCTGNSNVGRGCSPTLCSLCVPCG